MSMPAVSMADSIMTSSKSQQPMLCQLSASARRSLGNGLVELRHGTNAEHASCWLQVSHTFQPSVPRLDVQLEQTTVSLAFNLEGEAPMQQQVYAFLPLRSYGLSFIVQVSSQLEHLFDAAVGVCIPAPHKLWPFLHCPGKLPTRTPVMQQQ